MKYDWTSNLIYFRPVIKVKYINNSKAVFYFKQMVLFMMCLVLWFVEGSSDIIRWEKGIDYPSLGFFFFFCVGIGLVYLDQ